MRVSAVYTLLTRPPHPNLPSNLSQLFLFLNVDDAAAFNDEWRRETSRYRPQRGLDYRRHEGSSGRRAEGTRLAIQGPEDSPSRQSRRYDWWIQSRLCGGAVWSPPHLPMLSCKFYLFSTAHCDYLIPLNLIFTIPNGCFEVRVKQRRGAYSKDQ